MTVKTKMKAAINNTIKLAIVAVCVLFVGSSLAAAVSIRSKYFGIDDKYKLFLNRVCHHNKYLLKLIDKIGIAWIFIILYRSIDNFPSIDSNIMQKNLH